MSSRLARYIDMLWLYHDGCDFSGTYQNFTWSEEGSLWFTHTLALASEALPRLPCVDCVMHAGPDVIP